MLFCWLGAFVGVGSIAWIVGRPPTGVGNHGIVHGLYLLAYVLLPGVVILRGWWGRRLRWSEVLGVGLPLGVVAEALFYAAFVAAGIRAGYGVMPIGWLVVAWLTRSRIAPGGWLRGPGWRRGPAALIFVSLVVVMALSTVAVHSIAVGLEDGVLAAPTHHDWIYLLARAQEIVTHNTWEDPSLAGVRLSYHYLLLLHAAAAATVTGEEIDTVLFRTGLLPLGAALLAQVYWLGCRVTRRSAGGLVAMGLLLLPAAEWARAYEGGAYLDFYNRWLFVSPTFYLGLVFFGGLMIGIFEAVARPARWRWHAVGHLILAAGGALAKASVVPALAVAVTGWALAGPILRPLGRRCVMMVASGAVLTAGWLGVYALVLADWGSGDLQWSPGGTLRAMPFGKEHLASWATWLESYLPTGLAGGVGTVAVGIFALLALSGVRGAALVLLIRGWAAHAPLAAWVGWCAVASVGWGLLVKMDSMGQLYFLLPLRLPLAVLGAAGLCALAARIGRYSEAWNQRWPHLTRLRWPALAAVSVAGFLAISGVAFWVWGGVAGAIMLGWPRAKEVSSPSGATETAKITWGMSSRLLVSALLLVVFVGAGVVQVRLLWRTNETNLARWWRGEQVSYAESVPLRAALLWARDHVPRDAVFVADAFTSRHYNAAKPVVIDNTSIDKHYYYTAWAARRFWLEGTAYIQRRDEIAPRLAAADALFDDGVSPEVGGRPIFVLVDRALPGGGAAARAEWGAPLFANERAEIYAVP